MIKYIRAHLLFRKMRKFLPEMKHFEAGGTMSIVRNSVYINTGTMEVKIRCQFHNISSHVKDFFYSEHNKQLEIHREYKVVFKLGLNKPLSVNIAAMEAAYEETYEKVNKLLNDADSFFGKFVTSQISVSTPRGHFGTYFVDYKGVRDEHGVVTFFDPYTLKRYKFTHPFLYSILDAESYRSTFNDYYSPWPY